MLRLTKLRPVSKSRPWGRWVLWGLIAVAVVLGPIISSFDANGHREQITRLLRDRTGFDIRFNGPLRLTLSWSGVRAVADEVSIGNPVQGQIMPMAQMEQLSVGLNLLPLLAGNVSLSDVQMLHGVLDLSSLGGAAGDNRDLVQVERLAMSLGNGWRTLDLDGNWQDHAFSLNAKSPDMQWAVEATHPVILNAAFENYKFYGSGKINLAQHKIGFDAYRVARQQATFVGQALLQWGSHPVIVGNVLGRHVIIDEMPGTGSFLQKVRGQLPSKYVFNDDRLNLSWIDDADADLQIAVADVSIGTVYIDKVIGHLIIKDHRAYISPLRATMGDGGVEAVVNLEDRSSISKLTVQAKANDIDLKGMFPIPVIGNVITGHAAAGLTVASYGRTLHELAGNLNGVMTVSSVGRDIVNGANADISNGVSHLIGEDEDTGGNHCLVAYLTAQNGVVRDQGVLLHGPLMTIVGHGALDLHSEQLEATLSTHSDGVGAIGLMPSLEFKGPLEHPHMSVEPPHIMDNLTSLIAGDSYVNMPDVTSQRAMQLCTMAIRKETAHSVAYHQQGIVQKLFGRLDEIVGKLNNFGTDWLDNSAGHW
ncbi:MAG: hypothetical protein JO126_00080 [Alphaproteobacteria bacterium]|nr:hypothetical protein [Alphaproteobacteria bacterium]MBV8547841.1 hypothetical protein [Alphaproteobacteria bacterium]